ncbi:helix-turn-helix transcriptional regulator [Microbacterium sp. NPDC089189]|uniref:PadR family transcriptional regulator n=1 Tax=Microbacterium sp. NPDC089189 TaxID=3154972 RepID=UPI003413D1FC
MDAPTEQHYGYQLSRSSGLRSGVLYPILQRLLNEGWLIDGWEQIDPALEKRPARRYYTLTEAGMRELGALAKPQIAPAPTQAPARFA